MSDTMAVEPLQILEDTDTPSLVIENIEQFAQDIITLADALNRVVAHLRFAREEESKPQHAEQDA